MNVKGNILASQSLEEASYTQDTGSANSYVVDPRPAVSSLTPGLKLSFIATHNNSSAATLNVSGLGPIAVKKYSDGLVDLVQGDILTGQVLTVVYDGVQFQVMAVLRGYSGISGYSGTNGTNGVSGYSGKSGTSGYSGSTGQSGTSGFSGTGTSGFSGSNGSNGSTGTSGYSGRSGYSGSNGSTGTSGYSGSTGTQGASGFSGRNGDQGLSGFSGQVGLSGFSGAQGAQGVQGLSGTSGAQGYSGYSGLIGPRGSTGSTGPQGTSGYSGAAGVEGSSGVSGFSGIIGLSGTSGFSGASGYSGTSGTSGYSGASGTSGYSGKSGYSGTSGYSGVLIENNQEVVYGTGAGVTTSSSFKWDGNNVVVNGGIILSWVSAAVNHTAGSKEDSIGASSGITVSLPAVSSAIKGKRYEVKNVDTTGVVSVTPNGTDKIENSNSSLMLDPITGSVGSLNSAVLMCDGTGWWIVSSHRN